MLPKQKQSAFLVSDSWITITELGLQPFLGSGTKKKQISIYKNFKVKAGDNVKNMSWVIQYLFGNKLNRINIHMEEDNDSKFILGSSFKADGYSLSGFRATFKKT